MYKLTIKTFVLLNLLFPLLLPSTLSAARGGGGERMPARPSEQHSGSDQSRANTPGAPGGAAVYGERRGYEQGVESGAAASSTVVPQPYYVNPNPNDVNTNPNATTDPFAAPQ